MKGKAARKVAKEQAELTPRAAAVLLVSGKLPEVATSINGDVIRLDGAREIERRLNAFAEYRRWALHVLKKGQETGTAFLLREAGRVAAVCDEASCCDLANSVRLILPAIEDEDFERASDLERKILSNPETRSWFGVIRAIEIALSVRIVPAYNPAPMGDAAHDLNALASGLGYTFESAKRTLERGAAEATQRVTTSRATAEPRPVRLDHASKETTKRKRGPRVKPNPALPKEAPEIYRDRKPREELGGRKENIVQFIERVYAPWRASLRRADLRRLDPTADRGLYNSKEAQNLPLGFLPVEYELNTDKRRLEVERREKRLAKHRAAAPAP